MQATQRSIPDAISLAVLTTVLQVERRARAADAARLRKAADELRAVAERAAA